MDSSRNPYPVLSPHPNYVCPQKTKKKLINPLIVWAGREVKEKKRKGPGSATRPASEPLKASGVAYPPRTLGRVPGCVTLITTQPGTRIKSLSMRVGFLSGSIL